MPPELDEYNMMSYKGFNLEQIKAATRGLSEWNRSV
jgi:hypothetical protein